MTTATAQANPNIAFTKLSQGNTVFGDGEVGYTHLKAVIFFALQV
jgi:hypothetical protein